MPNNKEVVLPPIPLEGGSFLLSKDGKRWEPRVELAEEAESQSEPELSDADPHP